MSLTVALGLTVMSCGSSSSDDGAANTTSTTSSNSTTSVATTDTVAPGPPVGVIAIGHSGLTGEGTAALYQPVPENSWATGTSPDVNSIYLRLAAARPEMLGYVANKATGGAEALVLSYQAREALKVVPHPALAIISTIDNDIRCDGTDPQHVPEFGASVTQALDVIAAASPETKILVIGQAGRPSPTFVQQLVAHDPTAKEQLANSGICSFYDDNGVLDPLGFETLTSIIDSYEAEQARVCAAVPQCSTDGGVRAAYRDQLDYFSSDWSHANVRGQAAAAELMWPVVAALFGI